MGKTLRITLCRSRAGKSYKQRQILDGLGLRRLNRTVLRPDTPEIRGMIAKVVHLVKVEELEDVGERVLG
ncbi:MAG: 50S ribosomal protein L30 [candidate division NC10 bacterium]|nr:50S ribosomal protein L30 [candidate division NC10 bacterium]